ncbi:hypothetical protein SEVIR_7G315601v4 [Setaria viridis]
MLAWWFLRAVLACRPPTLTRSASSLPSPPAAPARRLLLFLFPALPTAVAGDGGLLLQVRALQDRRQGGLPRHAPLLRHGQPPPPPPGYVLVCPKREVKRFADLSSDETSDLWVTAKEVGVRLEKHHKASSLTFAIQDGPQAGQTVPHVHIHVIPRKKGDFEKNDEIYDAIDVKEKELKEKLDLDIERKDRSMEEMAHEANEYRALFSI